MGEPEKVEEIKVTRFVQAVLVLNAGTTLSREFRTTPSASPRRPSMDVTIAECSLRAEFVPALQVLIIDMKAVGRLVREAFKNFMGDWPRLPGPGFEVPDDKREYVTVGSHQEAVVAAVSAWQKWQAEVRACLDSQLKELVVQEVMEA